VPPDEEKATFPTSARALIQETLEAIVLALETLPASAKTRELRRKAESFKRILEAWDVSRPAGLELAAVGERISNFHETVTGAVAAWRRPLP
jgi:hypothetical protein